MVNGTGHRFASPWVVYVFEQTAQQTLPGNQALGKDDFRVQGLPEALKAFQL